jgi:hypothetical protein
MTGDIKTLELQNNEKFVGMEYVASSYIIIAGSFLIAKRTGPA